MGTYKGGHRPDDDDNGDNVDNGEVLVDYDEDVGCGHDDDDGGSG